MVRPHSARRVFKSGGARALASISGAESASSFGTVGKKQMGRINNCCPI
jgi:hypothetical protein